MDLPKQLQEEPVVFNKEAGSYFMVRYDARSLCKLAKLLRENHTRMSVVERAQLQEDVAPLADAKPQLQTLWNRRMGSHAGVPQEGTGLHSLEGSFGSSRTTEGDAGRHVG